MPDTPRQARKSLAAKLDHLFRTVRPKGGGEYTFEEVSDALKARGGPTISGTYIWQLRKGLRDNPTMRHLEALADFFGVPPAYFFDDAAAERIDAELALLTALRDSSIRQIALRASGLSTKSLDAITEMLERVRELEGLGDAGDHADSMRSE
ncbi:XRE family transcriptional regulator [Spongiactinospora gelatinilytica]|uniref:XRE family transcriptional regulator n=1 Tax=Spongiactinospora gelatinilytica TaxID=2666298 RepID=A0A2W2F9D0_9ACTN|nr:helix-turn-helix domain-containing protein [Spongiactinospora gelatinilytica]PZG26129.1 XRE family transcriptional regulator [Spongiactinospora gelatinilytica]